VSSLPKVPKEVLQRVSRRRLARDNAIHLGPFINWLQENTDVSLSTSHTYASAIWSAHVATGGKLAEALKTPAAQATKITLRAALKQWALFSKDDALLAYLASHDAGRELKNKHTTRAPRARPALDPATVDEFLSRIQQARGDGEPWIWPILSIMIKLGLRARSDVTWVAYRQVTEACEVGSDEWHIWSKGSKLRTLPTEPVREELLMLANWPTEWKVAADIISPRSPFKGRHTAAYDRIRAVLGHLAYLVGVEPELVHTHAFRHAAALRLYEITGHDIEAVRQLLGHGSITTTQKYIGADRTKKIGASISRAYAPHEGKEKEKPS
jgi:integrase